MSEGSAQNTLMLNTLLIIVLLFGFAVVSIYEITALTNHLQTVISKPNDVISKVSSANEYVTDMRVYVLSVARDNSAGNIKKASAMLEQYALSAEKSVNELGDDYFGPDYDIKVLQTSLQNIERRQKEFLALAAKAKITDEALQDYIDAQLSSAYYNFGANAKQMLSYEQNQLEQVYDEAVAAEQRDVFLISALAVGVLVVLLWMCHQLSKTNNYLVAARNDLQRSLEKEKQSGNAKTQFLSNVSHDMRTPLNGILGCTELALEAGDEESTRIYLKKIQTSGNFLMELLNDTLEVTKIESGTLMLKPQAVDCKEMIESVVASVSASAEGKNITLVVDTSESSLGCILADRLKTEKILLNLLSNAVKFTPAGGKIEFIVADEDEPNGKTNTKIIVRDNGRGISEEFMPRLFEPFTQEYADAVRGITGTGLGLSIVHELIALMEGRIEVKSKKDEGTEFTVYLKFERADPMLLKHGVFDDPAVLSGKRILICEDNELNAEILKAMLEQRGMESVWAQNGKCGVELLSASEEGYFDAVIMDVRMPVMDGLTAARTIRALDRPDARAIPILAVTADALSDDVRLTHEAGMNVHLTKPVDADVLFAALQDQFLPNAADERRESP